MAAGWANHYRQLLAEIVGRAAPSHAFPLTAVQAAETRLGVKLPKPLRDYYVSVGRHKLNRVFNRLLAPKDLSIANGRLVFMEENQCVVFWGVRARTAAADPTVFQTVDPEDEQRVAESRCSEFLPAMLCWQAVNDGLRYVGFTESVAASICGRFSDRWRLAGRIGEMSAFVRSGQVACVITENATAIVHLGTRNRTDFDAVGSEIGVAIERI